MGCASIAVQSAMTGLGNQATLAKIDRMRELNVGAVIPLPQLVVVGDQSSGKSSVLESLTGFSFPRGAGLCTRYATQITCRRGPEKGVLISIIPRPVADGALKERLLGFRRQLTDFSNDDLVEVLEEANRTMGIRMNAADMDSFGAFSEDILKIEISGPKEDHLTVIDVPGIFRVPTPGRFLYSSVKPVLMDIYSRAYDRSDIKLVENIVKAYMANSRTIILAVMPCTVDVATQEILKLAKAADSSGIRTMGVLTKPDLAREETTRAAIIDLVLGKGSTLRLGHFIVMNRSADDKTSTLSDHANAEKAFFANPIWPSIRDRCGVPNLKPRLHELLMHISNQEFPLVKADIEKRLRQNKETLAVMGPSRASQDAQRLYLGRLAARFQEITHAALNGHYTGEKVFKTDPELKLITKIVKLNEVFSNIFWKRGHKQHFGPAWRREPERSFLQAE